MVILKEDYCTEIIGRNVLCDTPCPPWGGHGTLAEGYGVWDLHYLRTKDQIKPHRTSCYEWTTTKWQFVTISINRHMLHFSDEPKMLQNSIGKFPQSQEMLVGDWGENNGHND